MLSFKIKWERAGDGNRSLSSAGKSSVSYAHPWALVPLSVRWQVLRSNHDDVEHFVFEKTLQLVRSLFRLPKIRKFVKKYVGARLEYAQYKLLSGTRGG
ncbi:hypothetical protein EVAR_4965_1 [Eumeta japonica]|uniref:Integrase zinc-binding domain-containing protein n=1 Tax=Eumeta variegata TaxID=151549 RepID=A0A4C1UZS7_EUMVA|nr:hypothetical protein EVAR_4965_1 [Eumeta japonica]